MAKAQHQALRDLLRRVDEVRGLSEAPESATLVDPSDPTALVRTVGELVDELERSHRRLIESNVQLVSLREVAGRLTAAADVAETTRTVTRYLSRAFGFEHAFLLLLNRETGALEGTWTRRGGERDHSTSLEVPLLGDRGAVARSLWLDRTVRLRDLERHPAVVLADGHPLQESLARLGSLIAVPLKRHSILPDAEPHELCGARCVLGDVALLAPAPGQDTGAWAADREERQRHCLGCDLMPALGVIGAARSLDAPPLGASEATLIESIALSVAPVVENARLIQDLRRAERFRFHVLESMASALVAVNLKGEILTFNRSASELLGYEEDEVRGQPLGERFGPDAEHLLRATLEQGQEVVREATVMRAHNGTPVPVSLTTSLLRDERRNVYGAIATFVDLTPLRKAEEHARSMDRLAALGRFTSSVAHEIRNPLTGIGAGVQYLARAMADDAPQRQNLDFILGEIRRLDRIVQDLFNVTHPRPLERRVALLDGPLQRAVQSLDAVLEERDVEVDTTIVRGTPPVAHDEDQMQQLFINLIKNAAEASPAGSTIHVRVQSGPRERRRPATVIVQVEDQGPGIPAEHLRTLFEPFFTTKAKGTGLGLYICQDIVRRHGGNLTVQSEVGHGATFRVELPLDHQGGES